MRFLVIWVLYVGIADAATICRQISTGAILETYSHDDPSLCQQNLVVDNPQYGFAASDIEAISLSESERQIKMATWDQNPDNPLRPPLPEPEQPVDIPIEDFGAGVAGAFAVLGGRGLVVKVMKKRVPPV